MDSVVSLMLLTESRSNLMQFLTFDNSVFVTMTIVNIFDASTHEVRINGKDLANALKTASDNYYNQDNTPVEILDEDCNIVTVSINCLDWNQGGHYARYYLSTTEIKIIHNIYKE